MYMCDCCGYIFDEPEEHRELREFWGATAYERIEGCPRCGGGCIEIDE